MSYRVLIAALTLLALAVPATTALQNGVLPQASRTSPLFQQQGRVNSFSLPPTTASSQWSGALMQQTSADNIEAGPSLWRRLRRRCNPLSALRKFKTTARTTTTAMKTAVVTRTWKKVAAAMVALFIVFSPVEPPVAHASDYFAPPAHANANARVVPSPYKQKEVVTQETPVQQEQPVATQEQEQPVAAVAVAEQEAEATPAAPIVVEKEIKKSKKTPSFSGTDSAGMAMKRRATAVTTEESAAKIVVSTAAAAAPTVEITDRRSGDNDILAISFVTAAAIGGTLGTMMSSKNDVGDYEDYDEDEYDEDYDSSTDSGVGGFSKHKPIVDGPKGGSDDDDKMGLLGGFGTGIGGFGKDFKEQDSEYTKQEKKKSESNKNADSGTKNERVGGFSQHKPDDTVGGFGRHKPVAKEEPEEEEYHNRGLETFSEISGYKFGYDHDEDEALDEEMDDDEDVAVGGFSSSGRGFGLKKLFGGGGSFSKHKPVAPALEEMEDVSVDGERDAATLSEKDALLIAQYEAEWGKVQEVSAPEEMEDGSLEGEGDAETLSAKDALLIAQYEAEQRKLQEVSALEEMEGGSLEGQVDAETLGKEDALLPEVSAEDEKALNIEDEVVMVTNGESLDQVDAPPLQTSSEDQKPETLEDEGITAEALGQVDTPPLHHSNGADGEGIAPDEFQVAPEAIVEDLEHIEQMVMEHERLRKEEAAADVFEDSVVSKEDTTFEHLTGVPGFLKEFKDPTNGAEKYVKGFVETCDDVSHEDALEDKNVELTRLVVSSQDGKLDDLSSRNDEPLTFWFEEMQKSIRSRTTDEAEASPIKAEASDESDVFFFATMKEGQRANKPPEPEDVAVFAGVVDSNEEHADEESESHSVTTPMSPFSSFSDVLNQVAKTKPRQRRANPVKLIPINDAAVDLASGLLGAAVGFSVGGPIVSLLGASAANYASRDYEGAGDMHDITQMIAESTIGSINLAGSVLNTFDVDELILDAAEKDEVQPLVTSAKGTLKTAGDVLSVAGDLNFLFVKAAVDLSNKVELPKKSSALIHDWWDSVYNEKHEEHAVGI